MEEKKKQEIEARARAVVDHLVQIHADAPPDAPVYDHFVAAIAEALQKERVLVWEDFLGRTRREGSA